MAGIRNRGHYWQIWWLVHTSGEARRVWGRLLKLEYPTKRQAQREAMKREVSEEIPLNKFCLFSEYVQMFLDNKHVTESSLKRLRLSLNNFSNFLQDRTPAIQLKNITEKMIHEYIDDRRSREYEASGINYDVRILKELFKETVIRNYMLRSPAQNIKYLKEEKKVKDIPTKDEVERILKWFQKNEPRYYACLYFQATRGWRRDELRLMRVNAVDLAGKRLYVRNTKIKEQRLVRLSYEDCLVLNEHLILLKNKKLYHPSGYLFPSRTGNELGKNAIAAKLKRACRDLEIKKIITNHTFRHYVVTSILNNTSNMEVVKAITGHKDARTIIEHYSHANPEMVDRGLEITRIDTGLLPKKGKKK